VQCSHQTVYVFNRPNGSNSMKYTVFKIVGLCVALHNVYVTSGQFTPAGGYARLRSHTRVSVGPIASLKGPYFQPSLSVCVCVCLCVTSTLQRCQILMKLGHKGPTVI